MLNTKVKAFAALFLLLGIGLATAIVVYSGIDDVSALLGAAGVGLLIVVPWAPFPMLFAPASWRMLFASDRPPPPVRILVATWIGLAVNWLLPVAQLGGDVIKARWLMQRGCSGVTAVASVVIDKTLQAASQILFAIIGVVLIMALIGTTRIALPVAFASLAFAALIFLFYRVQRAGMFGLLGRAARRISSALDEGSLNETVALLDARILDLYRNAWRMGAALGLRMGFRILMAVEVWLAMKVIGHPVSLTEAIVIESLTQMARGAAFMIPAGLGAQEGALVLILAALGHGPEVAVALAAAKRVREVCIGVPGLIVWQIRESEALRRMLRRRR